MRTERTMPLRVLRPNGQTAYTVLTIPEIDWLPWAWLCRYADAVGYLNPIGAYAIWPQEFRPMSVI